MNNLSLDLTDYYQFKMIYLYFSNNKHNECSVFEVFFRNHPFNGDLTIFAGINNMLESIESFKLDLNAIDFIINKLETQLNSKLLNKDGKMDEFKEYLRFLHFKDIEIYSTNEGSVVLSNTPIVVLKGPLAKLQILETIVLNFLSFPCLVATNAANYRMKFGFHKNLVEFGLRRAQSIESGINASVYSYVGGFDSTSNVHAGRLYDIPITGTIGHSFVLSFQNHSNLDAYHDELFMKSKNYLKIMKENNLFDWQDEEKTNEHELLSFCSYASHFSANFLVVLDTFNVLKSGLPNYCAVALGLIEDNYVPIGIRLDSGNLTELTIKCRQYLDAVSEFFNKTVIANTKIFLTNNINIEEISKIPQKVLDSIYGFGIGTDISTCSKQSSLGLVYKLVEIDQNPVHKRTEDLKKLYIPAYKNLYRYFQYGKHIADVISHYSEKLEYEKEIELYDIETLKPVEIGSACQFLPILKKRYSNGQISKDERTIHQIRSDVQQSVENYRQQILKLHTYMTGKLFQLAMNKELN